MQLRGRFTLWFVLAALVPIATAALVSRTILTKEIRKDAAQARAAGEAETIELLAKRASEVSLTVQGLANREDPYVGGTLLDLDTSGGKLQSWSRKRLQETGASLMRQLSLDLLYLLDHRYEVINSPHYPPALGENGASMGERAKRSGGAAFYFMDKVFENDQIRRVLFVESARQLTEGDYTVTVVGGRRIDAAFLDPIRKTEIRQIRIVTAEGAVLVPSRTPWVDKDVVSFPLNDSDGKTVAMVQLRVSNDALPALLDKVSLYSLVLALAALGITLLLGFLVARRMTRDLSALVVAAQAAARGDLDHQVSVRSRDEIGAVGEAFNTMMVDLKDSKERLGMAERVAAWQEIARRLAHEIKNPLTPIQMSMETLRKTYAKKHPSFDEVFEEATATVLEEAARLKRIVAEFSEFARMPKPNKAPLALNDLVRSQAALYQGSITIEKNLEEGLPKIEADKDTIRQLLLNLIENARDAIGEKADAQIVISTASHEKGHFVVLQVDDNGPGIPSEMRDKLFTPYFTTKHAQGGTGLGLAIAHRIVSDHHGKISVGDSDSGGARFTIELPIESQEELY